MEQIFLHHRSFYKYTEVFCHVNNNRCLATQCENSKNTYLMKLCPMYVYVEVEGGWHATTQVLIFAHLNKILLDWGYVCTM